MTVRRKDMVQRHIRKIKIVPGKIFITANAKMSFGMGSDEPTKRFDGKVADAINVLVSQYPTIDRDFHFYKAR